jgi:lipopolysaccharide/colanic/teichoic acid biosynthesis glycosyltransferase
VYAKYFKRIFDVVGAIVLMLSFSWLFLAIILVYVGTLQFPFFFTQERIGRNEESFMLVKFRTLRNNGASLSERRFFPGSLLRALSLDELPQLWNVLCGEMSLIGPRPLPVAYLPFFSDAQRIRHTIRPGITGWAQVNGRHGISWPDKFKLDAFYVRNISIYLDIKIFLKTILLLVSFRRDLSLTEKPFVGERDQIDQ